MGYFKFKNPFIVNKSAAKVQIKRRMFVLQINCSVQNFTRRSELKKKKNNSPLDCGLDDSTSIYVIFIEFCF